MPVARETISAMSSASTSAARARPCACRRARPARLDLALDLPGAVVVLGRRRLVALTRGEAPVLLGSRVVALRLRPEADTGAGLVDQVDRLVGEEAVADVAVGELRRGDDRLVGDSDPVESLVPVAEAVEDLDRLVEPSARVRIPAGKRRSSAGSFSMFLRYSSSVVAPITWSSPRAAQA